MDEGALESADPRDEIVRLEALIEELAGRIESCRKVALASRIAIALGGVILLATLLGVIRFDPLAFLAAVAMLLGGFVLLGSNGSTAKEAAAQMAEADAHRTALIGAIELHVVGGRDTVH